MIFENNKSVVNADIIIIAVYARLEFLTYNDAENKKIVVAIGLRKRMKYWKGLSIPKLKSTR